MAQTKRVPVDDLEPHQFRERIFGVTRPRERFIRSIESAGGLVEGKEIVINQDGQIIDGVNRWQAYRYLNEARDSNKWDTIPCRRVKYDSEGAEERTILMHEDTEELVFSQKVRAARAYEDTVADFLKERQKAGVSIDEMEDPVEEVAKDPRLKLDAGEKLRSDAEAADYVGWGKTTYNHADEILKEAENGNERAQELVDALDSGEINSINAVYRELGLNSSEESNSSGSGSFRRTDTSSKASVRDGEYNFLPVIGKAASGMMASLNGDQPTRFNDEPVTWWEDDSVVPRHPFVFISPFGDANVPAGQYDWHDVFRFDDDLTVISDSGGFQLMSDTGEQVDTQQSHNFAKGKIHPETMVEWQVKNADIGPVLDYPPFGEERDPSNFEEFLNWKGEYFYPYMEKTAETSRRMRDKLLEMRDNGNSAAQEFTQLGVIQGRVPRNETSDEYGLIKDWHQRMLEVMGEPDGWGLSAKRADNLYHQGAILSYAASVFENPSHIHVFQAGSAPHLALLEFFSMRTGWSVTSDATSYLQRGSSAGTMAPPGHPGSSYDMNVRSDYPFDRYPCRCTVCHAATADGFEVADSGTEEGHIRSLHNLNHFLEFKELISALIHYYGRDIFEGVTIGGPNSLRVVENEFWETMKRHFSTERKLVDLARAMRAVDLAAEDGHESDTVRGLLRKTGGLTYDTSVETDAMAW